MPTNSTEMFCKPPSPQVNVVCLDSGDVLHDFFRVREINNIDLGGKGGHLLFRSTFFRFVTRVLARIVAYYIQMYKVKCDEDILSFVHLSLDDKQEHIL